MKSPACMFLPKKKFIPRTFRSNGAAAMVVLAIGALSVFGCSSGSSPSKVLVGAITFTDVNGAALKTSPTTLTVGQGTYVDVALTNDPQLLGADWSVACGSAPPPGTPLPPGQTQDESCGTFTPAHTMSGPIPTYVTNGTGYVAFYTAPAIPPKQGVVTLYASATSDHSRFATVTLTIGGNPISVSFAPAPPSTLQVGGSAAFRVALNNDATNAGVTWSAVCASSDCGFFGPAQTTSGVSTTYVAPAAVPIGGSVKVTATSIADPTKAVSATISITTAGTGVATGAVRAALQPVGGAEVTLYAAVTSATVSQSGAKSNNASALVTAFTDQYGNFSIPYGYECPTPDTQMYLVSSGGSAGGGINPNLTLMSALGPCSTIDASSFVINETTTVAAVYALSNLMTDMRHVGLGNSTPAAVATAFLTAKDIVDTTSGLVRARTVSGKGTVPQAEINTLANLINACAKTAGSSPGDGGVCDQLFHATNPGKTPSSQPTDTVQALLFLVRNAMGFPNDPSAFATLYQLAAMNSAFAPTVSAAPNEWTLAIQFPDGSVSSDVSSKALSIAGANPSVDPAGNIWVRDGSVTTELVGGASSSGALKALTPIAPSAGSTP